jgi:hypothetical protein
MWFTRTNYYNLAVEKDRDSIFTIVATIKVEKVSDHGTIGPRKFFEFPENISPRKKKIVII